MDRNREIALTQMRKTVEKLGSSTESYGEKTLMRFLIARSMDPEKAAKMFCQWKKWRAEMVPLGYISDSEVADELAAEKLYLQGLSKSGHPIVIVKVNKHFPSKDQVQFKKFVIHLLDKTIASSFNGREIGNEKLIAILDLQNITYSNVDTRGLITGFQFLQTLQKCTTFGVSEAHPMTFLKSPSNILNKLLKATQAYYPERLAACYLLHMPQFFVTIWRFICRFLEKATQEKMRIVTSEEEKEEFIREVGEDVLPEEYGGRAKLVLMQDVAVNY